MKKIVRRIKPTPPLAAAPQPPPPDPAPEGDWTRIEITTPEPKRLISLRLDADVLAHFQAQGKGYQTRINAVLRAYMLAQRRR